MYKIKYSAKAFIELDKIFEYILDDNNLYAVKVINNILKTIKNLIIFPYLWKQTWKFREFVEIKYKYRIIYKIDEINKNVIIVSIFKYTNTF